MNPKPLQEPLGIVTDPLEDTLPNPGMREL